MGQVVIHPSIHPWSAVLAQLLLLGRNLGPNAARQPMLSIMLTIQGNEWSHWLHSETRPSLSAAAPSSTRPNQTSQLLHAKLGPHDCLASSCNVRRVASCCCTRPSPTHMLLCQAESQWVAAAAAGILPLHHSRQHLQCTKIGSRPETELGAADGCSAFNVLLPGLICAA